MPSASQPIVCGNPLLFKWVGEWLDVERERNTRGVKTYQKAYESLKRCPLKFDHPSQAKQLDGIGDLIAKRLTEKMEAFCTENGLPAPRQPRGNKRVAIPGNDDDDEDGQSTSPPKKARKTKPYVPALRSGAYAIVIALATLDEDDRNGLSKAHIIELAAEHCDSSFTVPSHANKFFTAWNSMKTLQNKFLIYEKKGPTKKYLLTEEGWEVARRIQKSDPTHGLMDHFISRESTSPTGKSKSRADAGESAQLPPRVTGLPRKTNAVADIIPNGTSDASPEFEPIILSPGSFTIHLVLDNREVRAKKDRDYIRDELSNKGVTPIVRALALGDFLWVAKLHDKDFLSKHGGEGDEVLLDWIVERKRLDDLIGSIKDGRFHEQKFRLRKSGVKNVIYIIEEHSIDSEQVTKYGEAVEAAIVSTQVVSNYFVKQTQKSDDTIRYITCMTNMLKSMYEAKELHVIPSSVLTTRNYLPLLAHLRTTKPAMDFHITYSAFASLASKSETLTLRDVYLKMLMCTRGITGEKALEMQKRWKTPIELVEAFEKCGDEEDGRRKKMALVSTAMGNLVGRKKVAKALSVKVADVWGEVEYAEEVLG